jgi:hypothetical protein
MDVNEIKIDPHSTLPLYQQVAEQLRQARRPPPFDTAAFAGSEYQSEYGMSRLFRTGTGADSGFAAGRWHQR